jgi:flagellar biosynthesis/type III secretory pathway M-ring protein FliF/YscJ
MALFCTPASLIAGHPALDHVGHHLRVVARQLPRALQRIALHRARQLARDDPKVVANVVKGWVTRDE